MIVAAGLVLGAASASGQDMPNPQAMQAQVQRIAQERPREAEAAARAFLHVMKQRYRDDVDLDELLAGLDSLKARAPEAYWMEVAQLTAQFDMVQNLARRDSARAALVTRMFGLEVGARAIQRAYRAATEPQRAALRRQLEGLIDQHFSVENQLRELEILDIERRLAQVRAETRRRLDDAKRAELVKWAVDDIIRDALRPE